MCPNVLVLYIRYVCTPLHLCSYMEDFSTMSSSTQQTSLLIFIYFLNIMLRCGPVRLGMSKLTQVDFVPRETVSYSKETQTPTEALSHSDQKAGKQRWTHFYRFILKTLPQLILRTFAFARFRWRRRWRDKCPPTDRGHPGGHRWTRWNAGRWWGQNTAIH